MYSLDNYDLKLSLQRKIPFVDILTGYAGNISAFFNCGSTYGAVNVNGFVYVAIMNQFPSVVKKVDPSSGLTVADIPVGNNPRGLGYDGRYIWCCNYDLDGPGNTVTKIDSLTDLPIATINVGINPGLIEYDNNGFMWVACFGSTSVYKINIETNEVTTIPIGVATRGVAYDNRAYMWFTTIGTSELIKIRTTTNTVASVPMPTSFYGITSAAGFIWVTDFGYKIYKISPITLTVVATVTSSHSPTRRPAFDGKRVWIPCGTSEYTDVIDTETNKIITSINTSAGSNKNACFDGTNAYISVNAGLVQVSL